MADVEKETEISKTPPAKLKSLLNIEILLTVVLAEKKMKIKDILSLSQGSVIEFDKSIDIPLDLRIGNKTIARGEAVKLAEKFGLQIIEILSQKDRLKVMGQI